MRDDLHRILRAGVDAVDAARLVADALARGVIDPRTPRPPILVAAGKAAWRMAYAFTASAPSIAAGVVAGPRPRGGDLPASLEWFDASHPEPNAESERAGRRALALAQSVRGGASLIVLLSGGASAMLAVPASGITVRDKAVTARMLMNAGAPIDALNCVRKHLSAIKGGRLAAAGGGAVTLAISDVHTPIADDPAVIGSGPTVADPTTYADALQIVRRAERQLRAGIEFPPAVVRHLESGARGELDETVKASDPALARSTFRVIGSRQAAMEGAAQVARERGYAVRVIADATSGEARDAGRRFFESALREGAEIPGPVCVIASGETTVHVRGDGRGGRNQEFVLGAAAALAGDTRALLLASAGTDGIDGPTDAAGALVDPSTLRRAVDAGVDATAALQRNDAYPFFEALGDLIMWGPTGTNVGDLHVFLRG